MYFDFDQKLTIEDTSLFKSLQPRESKRVTIDKHSGRSIEWSAFLRRTLGYTIMTYFQNEHRVHNDQIVFQSLLVLKVHKRLLYSFNNVYLSAASKGLFWP